MARSIHKSAPFERQTAGGLVEVGVRVEVEVRVEARVKDEVEVRRVVSFSVLWCVQEDDAGRSGGKD